MKKLLVGLLALGSLSALASSTISGNFEANNKAIKEILRGMAQDSKKDIGKHLDASTISLGDKFEENKYIFSLKVNISNNDLSKILPLTKEKGMKFLCNHVLWEEIIRNYGYEVVYEYYGATKNEQIGSYSVTAADCKQLDIRELEKVVNGCKKAVISVSRNTKKLAQLEKETILYTAQKCEEFIPKVFVNLSSKNRKAMLKDPNRFGCSHGVKFMLFMHDKTKLESVKDDEAKIDMLTTRYCY